MEISVDSVGSMHQLGIKIGAQLKASDVVVLTGELGSGKTCLTQGIGKAFGISSVTSPTFVLSRIYKGRPNFIHIDAYRLLEMDLNNFSDLDFESYLESSVFVIEWGLNFIKSLTDQYLEIKINQGRQENLRIIQIFPVGNRWAGFKV